MGPKLISMSYIKFKCTRKYGRPAANLLGLLQWEVGQKAIIAMTLRNDAPQYFG